MLLEVGGRERKLESEMKVENDLKWFHWAPSLGHKGQKKGRKRCRPVVLCPLSVSSEITTTGRYLFSDGLCFSSSSSNRRRRNKTDKETKTKKLAINIF